MGHFSSTDLVDPATPIGALAWGVFMFLLAFGGARGVRAIARAAIARQRDATAVLFLQQLAQIVLWVAAAVLYAHLVPALRALGTALLAGASVASIVLGLAAQNTLGNLVAGVSLLLYRPFRVGERLQVSAPTGLETGVVEQVSLGYTVLRTFDNRRIVLPNSVAASQVLVNLSAVDPRIMAAVPVGIAYAADLDRARAILLELAHRHPGVLEVVGCPLVKLGDSSVTLSLRAWCADAAVARDFEFDLYEQAKKRLEEAGIEIPYPYTNVVVKREA